MVNEKLTQELLSYTDRVRHIIRRKIGEQDADDVYQETYLDALRNLHTFEHRSSLYTWLVRIALRRMADYYRDEERWKEGCATMAEEATSRSWEATLIGEDEHLAAIESAIAHVPKLYADTLRLRFLDGLSFKQIADLKGIKYEGARTRVRRSLEALSGYIARINEEVI